VSSWAGSGICGGNLQMRWLNSKAKLMISGRDLLRRGACETEKQMLSALQAWRFSVVDDDPGRQGMSQN
jgi:hypothetical protein